MQEDRKESVEAGQPVVSAEGLLSLIGRRQSDRSYLDRPVPEAVLGRVLEAGRLAPSSCNAQPWHFVVVTDADLRSEVARAAQSATLGINRFLDQAPVLIAVVQEPDNVTSKVGTLVKGTTFPLIDVGIAVGQMCLQARAEGLGSCIIGWVDQKKVRKLLGIPGRKPVPLLIALGYTDSNYREKRRKKLDEIVSYNRY